MDWWTGGELEGTQQPEVSKSIKPCELLVEQEVASSQRRTAEP
jgi:hypothetical protein